MTIFVYHSIGDILFCEPIYRHFWKQNGAKPTVIIRDHLMWLQQYIESAHFVKASVWGGDPDTLQNTQHFLNLRFANQIYRGHDKWYHRDFENCMLDKYRLAGLPEDLWKTITLNLNELPGLECLSRFFKIPNGPLGVPNYAIINTHCQAGNIIIPDALTISRIVTEDKMLVYMLQMSPFTVIDWWLAMYLAKENHHVSTCTFFLMQTIKNKFPEWNAPCYIYPRPNEDGLRGISQLHPDFNLIEYNEFKR